YTTLFRSYGIRGTVQGHIAVLVVAPIVQVHLGPEFLFPEDKALVQPLCNIEQFSFPLGVVVLQIKSDQWALGHPVYNFTFHTYNKGSVVHQITEIRVPTWPLHS